LKRQKKIINSSFTKEIMELSFTPLNKNHFGMSAITIRGGKKMLIDYWFTMKTAKLVKSKLIEEKYI
jgi:hypothetical protein